MREVVKKEVLNLVKVGVIYPVSNTEWVSLVQVVPQKGGMTVIRNEKNEFIPQRTVTGWRMCIDYWKLNKATRKDHFLLPFTDKMLEAGKPLLLLLPGWLLWLSSDSDPSGRPEQDHLHISIWHFWI
jgi:hypothetical protein